MDLALRPAARSAAAAGQAADARWPPTRRANSEPTCVGPTAENSNVSDVKQGIREVPIELTAAELDSLIASLEAASEVRQGARFYAAEHACPLPRAHSATHL